MGINLIAIDTAKQQDELVVAQRREDLVSLPTLIIEEISRGQKTIQRYKLTQPSISIGRGYDNDIILSDPHICPEHIRIDFIAGSWKISDRDSINGSFLEPIKNKKQNADQHLVNDGDIVNIGKSQLRLLFINHPVNAAIHFSVFESFINLMRQPLALFVNILSFIAIAASLAYLNSPVESNYSQFFVSAIGMALVFALWPAGIALISHLTKHDARAVAQIGISFAFFNLFWLTDFIDNLVAFNTASNAINALIGTALSLTLGFSLFWLNCYIGFHMTAKRRMLVSISITALLFGSNYLVQYSHKPEFNPRPQYNATIMAPNFLFVPSRTVDQFMKNNELLFKKTRGKAINEK